MLLFVKLLGALSALVVCAHAAGTFAVLNTPNDIKFDVNPVNKLHQSNLTGLLSIILGYPYEVPWEGLSFDINTVNYPRAVVAIVVNGVDSLGNIKKMHQYELENDESEKFTWWSLYDHLSRKNETYLIKVNLNNGRKAWNSLDLGNLKLDSSEKFKLKFLSRDSKVDNKFLEELNLLLAIANNIKTHVFNFSEDSVDECYLYWFVVTSLKPVLDAHKNDPQAVKEALRFLDETIETVNKAFIQAYNNEVVVTAFTSNSEIDTAERRKRDFTTGPLVTQEESKTNKESEGSDEDERSEEFKNQIKNDKNHGRYTTDKNENVTHENLNEHYNISTQTDNTLTSTEEIDFHNITHDYNESVKPPTELLPKTSEDFPVIFNIVFWFMLIFFFSLLAICIFIAEMDPGRDSIIYRMTSNRMKKDN